ncbi:MAG: hypothetical protein J0L97_09275, partial [Alphaproteobacteria bacterium]|nr:hypothetical protein [Alphaproteobacteria bacterium]
MRYSGMLAQLGLFFVFKPNRLRVIWFVLGVLAAQAGNHLISISHASLPAALNLSKHTLPYTPTPMLTMIPEKPQISEEKLQEKKTAESAPPAEKPKEENLRLVSIREGDTLLPVLQRSGVSREASLDIIRAMRKYQRATSLPVGQEIAITPAPGKDGLSWARPARIALKTAPDKLVTIEPDGKGNYRATSADLPLKKAMMKASGKINGSLYEAAVKSGVPASLLGEIIEAYSYDVDFQRDIQPGDK